LTGRVPTLPPIQMVSLPPPAVVTQPSCIEDRLRPPRVSLLRMRRQRPVAPHPVAWTSLFFILQDSFPGHFARRFFSPYVVYPPQRKSFSSGEIFFPFRFLPHTEKWLPMELPESADDASLIKPLFGHLFPFDDGFPISPWLFPHRNWGFFPHLISFPTPSGHNASAVNTISPSGNVQDLPFTYTFPIPPELCWGFSPLYTSSFMT